MALDKLFQIAFGLFFQIVGHTPAKPVGRANCGEPARHPRTGSARPRRRFAATIRSTP